jgi:hypothetical protein
MVGVLKEFFVNPFEVSGKKLLFVPPTAKHVRPKNYWLIVVYLFGSEHGFWICQK